MSSELGPKHEEFARTLEQVFKQYHKYLGTVCYDKLRRRGVIGTVAVQLSDDLVSSVYEKLLKSPNEIDVTRPEPEVKSFLLTQLDWVIGKHFNKEWAQKRSSGEPDVSLTDTLAYEDKGFAVQVDPSSGHTEEAVDASRRLTKSIEIMRQTDPDLAKLVELKLEGNELDEISRKSGKPLHWAKQNWYKAYKVLKNILNKVTREEAAPGDKKKEVDLMTAFNFGSLPKESRAIVLETRKKDLLKVMGELTEPVGPATLDNLLRSSKQALYSGGQVLSLLTSLEKDGKIESVGRRKYRIKKD